MTDDVPSNQRVWDWILKALVPISIAYFGWSITTVVDLDQRLKVIESNRYTPADALEYERQQSARWLSLENRLTLMEGRLEAILIELRKNP